MKASVSTDIADVFVCIKKTDNGSVHHNVCTIACMFLP